MSDAKKSPYGGVEEALVARGLTAAHPADSVQPARAQRATSAQEELSAVEGVITRQRAGRNLAAAQVPDDDSDQDGSLVATSIESEALQHIHAWVKKEGLSDQLQCLPYPDAYTITDSPDPKHVGKGTKILFLGEDKKFQAWARMKEYKTKPDEIEYLAVNLSSGSIKIERNIKRLPIRIYPFDQAAEKKTDSAEKGLTVLVRYILRETGHIDKPFTPNALNTFKVVLNVIGKAVEGQGGDAEKLFNATTPTILPHEITPTVRKKAAPKAKSRQRLFEAPFDPSPPPRHQSPSNLEQRLRHLSMTPLPPINMNGKRVADLNDDERFEMLKDLKAKRIRYEQRETEIKLRQQEEMRRLREREQEIYDQEERLLEGKSATWLIAQQRKLKAEEE